MTVRPLRLALVIVAGGLIAQLIFNAYARAVGWGFPYTTFSFTPTDRFADFFKLLMAYPGPTLTTAAPGLQSLFETFEAQKAALAGTRLNAFHQPPLPTLLALLWREASAVVDPALLYAAQVLAGAAVLAFVVSRAANTWLALAALLSYPLLLLVDRGHLFSLFCGIALFTACTRKGWVAVILFAVALNFRPNAVIIPIALWLGRRGWRLTDLQIAGLATVALFLASLGAANALYPAYTLSAFVRGLDDYNYLFVVNAFGLAYGSSLLGAFKFTFGFNDITSSLALVLPAVLLAATLIASRRGFLTESAFLFLIACCYALITHVFADYHLLVFLVPLAWLAREEWQGRAVQWATLLASCLVLIPKNYAFQAMGPNPSDYVSWQVLLNPLILFAASVFVISKAFWERGGQLRGQAADGIAKPRSDLYRATPLVMRSSSMLPTKVAG